MEVWTLLLPVILAAWTDQSEAFVGLRYSTTNDSVRPSESPKRTESCECSISGGKGHPVKADCSNRGLHQVPECVSNFTRCLLMSHNDLPVLQNKCFERFSELEILDISHCNILRLNDSAFEGLGKLLVLDISNNKLPLSPDTYRTDVFRPLERLKKLYLGNNTHDDVDASAMDYPDQALARLTSLEQLGMDGLRNRGFGSGFSNMTSLRVLDVSGVNGTCRIEALLNDTFVHLGGLTHLSLEECRINHTETGTFLPLRALVTLSMSGNTNLTFDGFTTASIGLRDSRLKVLKLNRIDIRCIICKTLCPAYLGHLQHLSLEELHLNENNLRYIAENITDIIPSSLKRLFIRDNDVFVNSNLLRLAEWANLTEIDAGCKDPRTIAGDSDRTYTTEGNCDPKTECPLFVADDVEIGRGMIPHHENMKSWRPSVIEKIDLSWQRILININKSKFNASNLKYLDITGMILPHWIGPVSGMENVIVLNLSNNFAHTISDSFFMNMTNIEVINVSWNSFYHLFEIPVNQSAFFPLKKLRVVDLSENQLTQFPNQTTELFKVVEELYLAGNKLVSDWFDVDFSLLKNLRVLDLSRNSLTTIGKDVCKSLETLASSRNKNKVVADNERLSAGERHGLPVHASEWKPCSLQQYSAMARQVNRAMPDKDRNGFWLLWVRGAHCGAGFVWSHLQLPLVPSLSVLLYAQSHHATGNRRGE